MPGLFSTLGGIPELVGGSGSVGPLPCPGGGSIAATCDPNISVAPPSVGPPEYTLTFAQCTFSLSSGRTLVSHGTLLVTGAAGQACGVRPDALTFAIPALALSTTAGGTTTTATITDMNGVLTLAGDDKACGAEQIGAEVSGSIASTTMVGGQATVAVEADFATTRFDVAVADFDALCSPSDYVAMVNGGVTFSTAGHALAVVYDDYRMATLVSASQTTVEVDGQLQSGCFGGAVTFATMTPLVIDAGGACPATGAVDAVVAGATQRVAFSGGGIALDVGGDGVIDATVADCRAPQLFVCP